MARPRFALERPAYFSKYATDLRENVAFSKENAAFSKENVTFSKENAAYLMENVAYLGENAALSLENGTHLEENAKHLKENAKHLRENVMCARAFPDPEKSSPVDDTAYLCGGAGFYPAGAGERAARSEG